MYSSFYGTIEDFYESKVVINVNDIGYEINMPENQISNIFDKKGNKIKVYTHFHVREDDMRLFGFLERNTLNFFRKLINVSGVGPKVALGIISNINVEEMCMAIINEDVATIKKIPGIGPKMAQKIIFELKEKIAKENVDSVKNLNSITSINIESSKNIKEAMQALEVLGFDINEVKKLVISLNISEEENTQNIIKTVLKELQKI